MFESSGKIIKDGAPLDYAYVPDKLVGREEEMASLEAAFRPLFFSNTPCSAYLHGHVGSGKTVTALRFCRDMADAFTKAGKRLDVIAVNCRLRNSEYSVMLDLVRHFDKGFPDRGFSVDEMFTSFRRHVVDGACPVVIILDEADVLLSGSGKDTVYQLTRADGMGNGASVSLMMVSQKPLEQVSLDAASRSTFGRASSIFFSKYDRDYLRSIAAQRAELALYPGALDDDCLDMIANNAEPYGDARFAIEILEKAANLAETNRAERILPEYIQKAGGSVHSDYSESKISALNLDRKVVLLAVARSLFKRADVDIGHAEGTYAAACEECGVPAKKHTQFYTYVKDLEKQGLLRTETRRDMDGGRALYISIVTIAPKDVAEILEGLIDIEKRRGDAGEVRSLRRRGHNLPALQRLSPLQVPFHQPRREGSQEGDPQGGRPLPRGHRGGGRIRRQGQHGDPRHTFIPLQREERHPRRRNSYRRGHRGLPSPVPGHRQEVLRGQGHRIS